MEGGMDVLPDVSGCAREFEEEARIRPLTQRLRRSDPVRQAAEAVLAGLPAPENAPQTLNDLVSRGRAHTSQNIVAIWTLARLALTEDDRRAACQTLAAVLRKRPSIKMSTFILGACMLSFIAYPVIGLVLLIHEPKNRVREAAANALSRIGGIECVDDLARAVLPLESATAGGDRRVRLAAVRALTNLLPTMP